MYNEEENIENLYQQVTAVATKFQHFYEYEIIAVNDGSTDKTLHFLKQLSHDPHLKIISFTRNFGHEAATTAGLYHAQGDAVAIMDADLQNPPEVLLQFESELMKGYEIVYAQRTKRLHESIFKQATSKIFYPIFRWLTKLDIPRDVGDFCMLSKRALNAFKNLPERSMFVRGMIYWSGLPKKSVPFVAQKRAGGKTKYTYWKLTKFAIDNIISFSTTPIYFIVIISLISIIACVVETVIALIMKFNGWVIMSGWTSIIISQLFLFSVTLFFLGIIGLYIGKIFEEIKSRPRYVVEELVNFEQKTNHIPRVQDETSFNRHTDV